MCERGEGVTGGVRGGTLRMRGYDRGGDGVCESLCEVYVRGYQWVSQLVCEGGVLWVCRSI